MPKLTPKRETLIHRASELSFPHRWILGNLVSPIILLWMETALLLIAENSEPMNSQSSRLQAIPNDHVKIGPVTAIEVFESAGWKKCKRRNDNRDM